ncbi:class I adenylate-forming enzyme family protein [Formosa undariae]|uniref:Class I adenylate-forming enzyme family protein n=1 Tax=Formosa undariae TaxID=1325436 RepID=A0ABV5F065_9FLAO
MTRFVSLEEKIYNWALKTPDKTALIHNKNTVSYNLLWEHICHTKSFLEAQFALKKNDSVLLAANKNVHFIYAYFAIHLIGAKVLPLDEQIQTEHLKFITDRISPKLILGLELDHEPRCYGFEIFNDVTVEHVDSAINFPDRDAVADILFTTGTTGIPKGVMLSHGNIASSAKHINTFIKNNEQDVELLALPISHSFGLGRIKCTLSSGGTLVLLGSMVNIKRLFRTFEDHKISGFGMVPASWQYLKKMSGTRLADFAKQLHYIELGSAPMSLSDKLELMKLFPTTRICMHYGLTEASRSTFIEFHSDATYLETIGIASPNVDIIIADEFGHTQADGVEGEICIKGDHVTIGYINQPKAAFFFNDYFRTGDIGHRDQQGYITLKGRFKEIINVGGKKLSPVEVESKIEEFDPLLESACIGVADPEGILGEIVKVCIVKNNSRNDFNDINMYLKTKLDAYKVPVIYEWIAEIPKTKSGKIQRQKLK